MLDEAIRAYYDCGIEQARLFAGGETLELVRTQELLRRYMPQPPARVLDVGGGAVPWVESVPVPIEATCRNCEAGVLKVPLHPGAARYWREAGYRQSAAPPMLVDCSASVGKGGCGSNVLLGR